MDTAPAVDDCTLLATVNYGSIKGCNLFQQYPVVLVLGCGFVAGQLTYKGREMGNVIQLKRNVISEWTREIPEHDTLLALCSFRPVKVFELEVKSGEQLVLAHFKDGDMTYIYQNGSGILTGHMFFYVTSYEGEETAENIALDIFKSFNPLLS